MDADNFKTIAYVVRHGTTQYNQEGKFRGPTDVPLDDQGLQDASKLSDYFKNIDIGSAWTSDKQRAEVTAQTILEPKGQEAQSTENLRAFDVGFLAGQKKDSDTDQIISYFQHNPDEPIPNGESLNQFRARVRSPLLNAVHTGIKNGKPSLVVAHSSVIHELSNLIHNDHTAALVQPGGVVGVQFNGKKFRAKPLLNEDKSKKDQKYAS